MNSANAFDALFRLGVVPVVNENDATATDEITSATTTRSPPTRTLLVRARLLVLLTEVEGVYSEHPATEGARLLAEGEAVGGAAIGPSPAPAEAGWRARSRRRSSRPARASRRWSLGPRRTTVLGPIAAGEHRGTRFRADESGGSAPGGSGSGTQSRRRAGSSSTRGRARRWSRTGASLLAVGVVGCEGTFVPGDAVELAGPDGAVFAKGIASAGAVRAGAGGRAASRPSTATGSWCTEDRGSDDRRARRRARHVQAAADEQSAISRAVREVEDAVGSLRGRKFYGAFDPTGANTGSASDSSRATILRRSAWSRERFPVDATPAYDSRESRLPSTS